MKRNYLIFAGMLGLLFTANAAERALESRFELSRKLEGSFTAGQQGRLRVTADMFGQSRVFPKDLRIFNEEGVQWPFFLETPQQKGEVRTLTPEILNRSFVEGDEPYLQFDLVIPEVEGKVSVHNRMELVTSGRDFIRRVEIYSGRPSSQSARMASGYLIDFSRQRNANNHSIRYPSSDHGRLHVRIYSNAKAAAEPFQLHTARLYFRAVKQVEREAVSFVELDIPNREREKGAQTHLLDIGEVGRPVEFITFEVADSSYARCLSVYGRNTEHDPWRWMGGGEIHSLTGDEVTTVKIRSKKRFLKVHVFHYDDQPLDLKSIQLEAIPRYLIFEAATDGTAAVYFRAWDIQSPRYDLKGRIDKETLNELPLIQLAESQPNKLARTQSWRKYSKVLGGIAVAAVSLLVIWVISSMLRQQNADQ